MTRMMEEHLMVSSEPETEMVGDHKLPEREDEEADEAELSQEGRVHLALGAVYLREEQMATSASPQSCREILPAILLLMLSKLTLSIKWDTMSTAVVELPAESMFLTCS